MDVNPNEPPGPTALASGTLAPEALGVRNSISELLGGDSWVTQDVWKGIPITSRDHGSLRALKKAVKSWIDYQDAKASSSEENEGRKGKKSRRRDVVENKQMETMVPIDENGNQMMEQDQYQGQVQGEAQAEGSNQVENHLLIQEQLNQMNQQLNQQAENQVEDQNQESLQHQEQHQDQHQEQHQEHHQDQFQDHDQYHHDHFYQSHQEDQVEQVEQKGSFHPELCKLFSRALKQRQMNTKMKAGAKITEFQNFRKADFLEANRVINEKTIRRKAGGFWQRKT